MASWIYGKATLDDNMAPVCSVCGRAVNPNMDIIKKHEQECWPNEKASIDIKSNLKLLLMTLGNRLVSERKFDPATGTVYNRNNTYPIKDFTNWLNGCSDAQEILADMGIDWPVAGEPESSLRDRILQYADYYHAKGSECERYRNVSGSMQMRLIANMLYALGQDESVETIKPREDEVRDTSVDLMFEAKYIVKNNSITRLVVERLERISLCESKENSESYFDYEIIDSVISIDYKTCIQGVKPIEEFKTLLSRLVVDYGVH